MPLNEIAERKAQQALTTRGHKEVVSILMKAYGDELYCFCQSMLNNPSDAQDVLQITFVQAFNGLDKFESKASFRTWLYVIARNRCLDEIKKAKRFDARMEFTDEVPETDISSIISSDLEDDPFMRKVLLQCMSKLSDSVRTALLLRFQSEYSYEEAAKIVQEKPGTLQARVARALPTLRRCIEESGVSI